MGSDGILVSTNKRIYCDIDRCHNFEDNRPGIWLDVKCHKGDEPGVSAKELIAIGEYNLTLPPERKLREHWINKGLKFLRLLDENDIVRLVPDDGKGDEYMDICYGKGWCDDENNWVKENNYSHSEYKEWDE